MQQAGAEAEKFRKKIALLREKTKCSQTGAKYPTIGTTTCNTEFLEQHGIYKRFWDVTIDNIKKRGIPDAAAQNVSIVCDYIKNIEKHVQKGQGFIFLGGVGTMKTTLAIAVLRFYLEKKKQGYFIPMVSLLDTLNSMRERHDGGLMNFENKIRNTPLLVLDDLGAEYDHTFIQAKVDAIIAERYNRMKATIITSNLPPKDILDRYQLRIFDRLKATNKLLVFNGPSLRQYEE